MPTQMTRTDPARKPELPRVRVPADPAVCRTLVLSVIGTVCCLGATAGLLSTSHFRTAWWAWVLVAILALPAVRPGPVTIGLAVADDLIVWAILGAQVGWPTALIVFGLHTGVTAWLLAANVSATGWWHRSALRTVLARWLWIQVVAQVASLLAAVTAGISDPLIGAAGLAAGVLVVLAVAYWGLRPRPERSGT